MLKNLKYSLLILLLILPILFISKASAIACGGRFPNPVTDVCWTCLFPIRIGPAPITVPGQTDPLTDIPPPLICECPAPPPVFVRFGIGISYWEPARVAEVVRTPFCSPFLGGAILGPPIVPFGNNNEGDDKMGEAFYHIHWFQFPLLSWIGSALTGGMCFASDTFDLAYVSELDPLWDDDELSFIINPEAILFANPVAQTACVADSISASLTMFGLDQLFWCSGSAGSVYPLDGAHANHIGGIDSSLVTVHKHIARMHRSFLATDTSTILGMCFPTGFPQPILRKNQYKQQMMYPIPNNLIGIGLGAPSVLWGAGREFPFAGEDFSYLIWRKRTCCAW